LRLLAGIWSVQIFDIPYYALSIAIQADGRFDGADIDGCVYLGSFSVVNPQNNVYNLSVAVSNCPRINGRYFGVAVIGDYNGITNEALVFSAVTKNKTRSLAGSVERQ